MQKHLERLSRIDLLHESVCIKASYIVNLQHKVFPLTEELKIVHLFIAQHGVTSLNLVLAGVGQASGQL